MANLELGNLMFNSNVNQAHDCPNYIIALLNGISDRLDAIMYNIHQEEYDSPFDNTGNTFKLGNSFTMSHTAPMFFS